MINIKKLIDGIRLLNKKDYTKVLELKVDDASITNTKTTVVSSQTADRTIVLPDVTGTLIANVNNNINISGVNISLNNTTENKLLVAGPTTGNSLIVDSDITHTKTVTDTRLEVNKDLTIAAPNKEIIIEGKAVRIPRVSFPIISPPAGNEGDYLFNTVTQSAWLCNSASVYMEQIADGGANRTLSNLLSPVALNEDIVPDTTEARDLGSASLRFDNVHTKTLHVDDVNSTSAHFTGDVLIDGDLTVLGNAVSLNTQTLDVEDANITVNVGGSNATAEGAGLTVERVGVDGAIIYNNTARSRFKVGDAGDESEIVTVDNTQTIYGQKIIDKPLKHTQGTAGYANVGPYNVLNINAYNNVVLDTSGVSGLISSFTIASPPPGEDSIDLDNATFKVVNLSSSTITIKHLDSNVTSGKIFINTLSDFNIEPGVVIEVNSFKINATDYQFMITIPSVGKDRIGFIESYAGVTVPAGHLPCDGRYLLISNYQELYNRIGDYYHKVGETIPSGYFRLPDLRGKFVRGATTTPSANVQIPGISLPTSIFDKNGINWNYSVDAEVFRTGDRVIVSGSGLSAPFTSGTIWYINTSGPSVNLTLHSTYQNAIAGTSPVSSSVAQTFTISLLADRAGTSSRFGSVHLSGGDTTGSWQEDALQNIQGGMAFVAKYNGADGAFTETTAPVGGWNDSLSAPLKHVQFNAANVARTSTETRPENIAINYIIRVLP